MTKDNLIERCIMIIPEFENTGIIDWIRARFDPVANLVKPHITLVFPFKSTLTYEEIRDHMEKVLASVQPFEITLRGIKAVQVRGNFIFLDIERGREQIIAIHKRLYTGILAPYLPQWLKEQEFYPHLTVGKIENEEEYLEAVTELEIVEDVFETTVQKVSVEIIGANQESIIEMEISL